MKKLLIVIFLLLFAMGVQAQFNWSALNVPLLNPQGGYRVLFTTTVKVYIELNTPTLRVVSITHIGSNLDTVIYSDQPGMIYSAAPFNGGFAIPGQYDTLYTQVLGQRKSCKNVAWFDPQYIDVSIFFIGGIPGYPFTYVKDIKKHNNHFYLVGSFELVDSNGDTATNALEVDPATNHYYKVCKMDYQSNVINSIEIDSVTNSIYFAGISLRETGSNRHSSFHLPAPQNRLEEMEYERLQKFANSKVSSVEVFPLSRADIVGDSLDYSVSSTFRGCGFTSAIYNGNIVFAGEVTDTSNLQFFIAERDLSNGTVSSLAAVNGLAGEGNVKTMEVFQNDLYLAGGYYSLTTTTTLLTNRMARLHNGVLDNAFGGITGCPLPNPWYELGQHLLATDSILYITGLFSNAGNVPALNAAKLSFSNTTSVSELHAAHNFAAYPNPVTDGRFTVEVKEDCTMEIKDISGRIVYEEKLAAGKNLVNTNNISKGVYLIQIPNTTAQKIVIN